GSFSKMLAPGLRLGWIVAPSFVTEKLVQAKQAADLHTSTLNQLIVMELLATGILDEHLDLLRAEYRLRRDAMLAALTRYFPEDISWTCPSGGMFLLVTLPDHMDAAALLPTALEKKVAFVTGEHFHLDGKGKNTFRLNFSNASPELIETGIQ